MTQTKLTKTQVQTAIFSQTINNQTIYYSYANKYQATLSILKNQRLLIFNSNSGLLYYVNEPKQLPFNTDIPKPKNDAANMNVSLAKNPPNTNEFSVQFGTKNQTGETTSIEWNFLLQNISLANSWLNLINDFKNHKIQQLLDQKNKPPNIGKNKPQEKSPPKNSRIITNNAFIHDTIGYGIMQPPKYNSRTPLSQPAEQPKYIESPIKLTESKHQTSPQKPTPSKPTENHLLLIPSVLNSRQSVNEPSPQRKSYITQNQSRLTFKDEIQDIVSRTRNNHPLSISKKSYHPETDWNLKFLQEQSEQVIINFEQHAVKQYLSILDQDRQSQDNIRVYLRPECIIIVTDARSVQAKKVKSEFRNYHFITESCKDHFIVGVPLSCLIQFEGTVAIVKSLIPDHAPKLELTQELILDLKDLERYTRVKNHVLKKATLYDLSQIYSSTGKRLIYINQLIEYLPLHIQETFIGGSLRPEHMLDNVDQFMAGGIAVDGNRHDLKILNDTLDLIKRNVSQLAKDLSSNDATFATCLELKDLMHFRGINLKHLPQLYHETQNKTLKKYIHTFMVAKIAKDNILQNLSETRNLESGNMVKEVIEKSMRLLVEGNSNMSNELWKQIAINYRKEYGTPMSNNDILGAFFLNCLMKTIPARYDLGRLNMSKVLFKEDGIIGKGFVVELLPKVKSYYRYTTQRTDQVMAICKGQRLYDNYMDLVEELDLKSKGIPRFLSLSKTDAALKQYMSFYTCPSEFEPDSFPHLNIFQPILLQPPTSTSLMITYNYLVWCLQKQHFAQFKQVLDQTLKIIDLWLDPSHVFHSEFYEALSQYYEQQGSVEDSINFMKESLAVCIRSGGMAGKKTGEKYFALGEKLLKAGNVSQSMENFMKSKANLENHKNTTIKYPLVLTKLASVSLSQSDFVSCLQYAKLAVQKFQQLQSKRSGNLPKGFYDEYSIKAVEVMSRAFEIEDKKTEIYRMAQLASSKYNKTGNGKVFTLMVKLCVTGVVVKQNFEKAKVLESIVEKMMGGQGEEILDEEGSLKQLMRMGEKLNVMERFMFKFESLQRVASEINSRRALSNENKEFMEVLRLVLGLVGDEYLFGLIQEKEVEG